MPLSLYNTYSKKDEQLVTLTPKQVTMYTCGPTVYGRPHIGNYSSFLMADLLRRWLEVSGYQVKHVKNITDVGHLLHDSDHGDDKIQKQAETEKLHPLEIARRYTEQYLEDEKALNMLEPMARPRASEFIKEQLAIIKVLLEKGNAYETDDGIYFAVETFPHYGALSGNTLQNLNAGARVGVDEKKKHPADFALWKKCVGDNGRHVLRWKFSTGEVSQSSGEDASSGFPGWHIECSAMSSSLLGDQIDLHTGGEDNIFPHHECEIAQSECATGKQFVRLWLHKRRIDLGDAKMSKSLGNILTVPDIVEKGYSPLDLRYYLLSVHYRTNLKFAWKGMDDARKARTKIVEWIRECVTFSAGKGSDDSKKNFAEDFADAMNGDLNTPQALAVIFDCMAWSRNQKGWSTESLSALSSFIEEVKTTFGCFEPESQAEPVPDDVLSLIKDREAARAAKDFKESDRLRDAIKDRGWDVKDTAQGQTIKEAR
ncbi:MAG: cysteine--tRNA ligase [Candidatus Peribacteraceae bacterium]|nr:cysteine--tRNA ligase [Candidatus Peribacteraceae bacterium]